MPPQCSFVQFDSRFAVNPDSPDPRRILASSRPCFLFRAIMCPTVMSSRMFAVSLWAAQAFPAFTRTVELFLQATSPECSGVLVCWEHPKSSHTPPQVVYGWPSATLAQRFSVLLFVLPQPWCMCISNIFPRSAGTPHSEALR